LLSPSEASVENDGDAADRGWDGPGLAAMILVLVLAADGVAIRKAPSPPLPLRHPLAPGAGRAKRFIGTCWVHPEHNPWLRIGRSSNDALIVAMVILPKRVGGGAMSRPAPRTTAKGLFSSPLTSTAGCRFLPADVRYRARVDRL
jgi:hypothetical protein